MQAATHSEARSSAAVVLARTAAPLPELLLVRRHANTAFGASHVFPGGVVDTDDERVDEFCDGPDEPAASRILGVDAGGLAYFSAAIRELFEETGILLARRPGGAPLSVAELAAERQALNEGRLGWRSFLDAAGLRLACDTLRYFAYWVTPREYAKRFSARFFLAALPPGQEASECGGEITGVRWTSARQALVDAEDGRILLPRPTAANLGQLSELATVDAMLEWSRGREADGVERIRPAWVAVDGERRVVLPGDPNYPKD